MNNENVVMKEREINFLDLMVEILLKWRVIVIAMLFGGALLGGFGYVQSVRMSREQQAMLDKQNAYFADIEQRIQELDDLSEQLSEAQEAALESVNRQWLEEQLTEAQINNVNNVILYEEQCKEKENYRGKSLLMQMDPLHVKQADLTFLIMTNDLERTYNIEKVYEDALVSTALYNYVKEQCNIEENVNDLISLERTSYNQMQGSDTVRIKVLHGEQDTCQLMADAIVSYVEEQHAKMEEKLGTHDIVLLNRSIGEVVSTDIMSQQSNCDSDIVNLRDNAIELKAIFAEEEWHYYNYLVQRKAAKNLYGDDKEEIVNSIVHDTEIWKDITVTKPEISAKFVMLGMILFAFVYVFIIFLAYIFSGKIRSTDSLHELYGVVQFGTITAESRQKKLLGVVDQWILKLRYLGERSFAPEESIVLTVAAVKMAAKKSGLAEVSVVGCNLSQRSIQVCERIQAALIEEKITVRVLNNILYDVEAMEALGNVQGVVLVETAGSTLYKEIEREIQLLFRQNIKVLGGIVLE